MRGAVVADRRIVAGGVSLRNMTRHERVLFAHAAYGIAEVWALVRLIRSPALLVLSMFVINRRSVQAAEQLICDFRGGSGRVGRAVTRG
eukprot:3711891-Pyramimonas_sp.AAC.1